MVSMVNPYVLRITFYMDNLYSAQAIFLIAGGLYVAGPDLAANARRFRRKSRCCRYNQPQEAR
jgi:hypothetical protein